MNTATKFKIALIGLLMTASVANGQTNAKLSKQEKKAKKTEFVKDKMAENADKNTAEYSAFEKIAPTLVGDADIYKSKINITKEDNAYYLDICEVKEDGIHWSDDMAELKSGISTNVTVNSELGRAETTGHNRYQSNVGGVSAAFALRASKETLKGKLEAKAIVDVNHHNLSGITPISSALNTMNTTRTDVREAEISAEKYLDRFDGSVLGLGASVGNAKPLASKEMMHDLPMGADIATRNARAPSVKVYGFHKIEDVYQARVHVGYSPFMQQGRFASDWIHNNNATQGMLEAGVDLTADIELNKNWAVSYGLYSFLGRSFNKQVWADVLSFEDMKDGYYYKTRSAGIIGGHAGASFKDFGLNWSMDVYGFSNSMNMYAEIYYKIGQDGKVSLFAGKSNTKVFDQDSKETNLYNDKTVFIGAQASYKNATLFVTGYDKKEREYSVSSVNDSNGHSILDTKMLTVGLKVNFGR